jgi:hypothetical protein
MYKGILILASIGLVLVFGTNYLLIYAVQQKTIRERDRQDKAYWKAFNAIEHFGEHPDGVTEHDATVTLDEARQARLSKNRESLLQTYFQDLQRCYQGARDSCNKVNGDMNAALSSTFSKP